MRVLIVIVVIVVIFGIAGVLVGPMAYHYVQQNMDDSTATDVRLEAPTRGDIIELVQAPGEVEPKRNVELSARISARIIALPFEEGNMVEKDDILIRLDSTDYDAALRGALARRAGDAASIEVSKARLNSRRASLESQYITLKQLNLTHQRNVEQLKTKDIAQATVDESATRVRELEASIESQVTSIEADDLYLVVMQYNLEATDADIEQRREELNYTVIRAPMAGIVTRLNAEVGELVMTGTMNNAGTVIMEIADLDTMLLVAQVDEADVGSVAVGQTAIVRINAYPDQMFEGIVEFIALTHSRASDGSKYFRTEVLLDTEGQRIYSGLTADVEIETRRHIDVIRVPSQSVQARNVDDLPLEIREDNPDVDMTKTFATVVYCFKDGKAEVRPVTIGPSDLTHTAVLSGLSEDEQIVVGPYKVLESISHELAIRDEREKLDENSSESSKDSVQGESSDKDIDANAEDNQDESGVDDATEENDTNISSNSGG